MPAQPLTKPIVYGLVALTIGVGSYLGLSSLSKSDDEGKRKPASEAADSKESKGNTIEGADPSFLEDADVVKPTVEEAAERMGMTMEFDDPKELVNQVMKRMTKVNSERDIQDLAKMLGNGVVDSDQLAQLSELYAQNRFQLRDGEAMELIGEVRAGKVSRWALHLSDTTKIQLQTTRQPNGKWKVDQVQFPLSNVDEDGVALTPEQIEQRNVELEAKDSLVFSNHFLKALVEQDFGKARLMAGDGAITDAKIAGLCILFEDGSYRINEEKPLQAVRMTEEMAAFYVNVKSNDNSDAQFSVNSVRDNADAPWQISEINLDRLLEDYAKKVAGGDVYYTPLIKSPSGGDMLVIYFEFDSNGLTDRTKKQLDIVANLLKLDKKKKVRLSGHTDGKGSDDYNQGLSQNRAVSVKQYLGEQGINAEQIVTEAHGFSQPRRQEQTKEDGSDDPRARRVNRRTEIYLDF